MSRNWLLSFVAVVPLLAAGGIAGKWLNSSPPPLPTPTLTIDVYQIQTGIDVRNLSEQQITDFI
jgi:hypothetical protein